MTKELDSKLLEILNSTTEAIGNGVDLVVGELPDVIYQLLLWYGVRSAILFILSMTIIVGSTALSISLYRKMLKDYNNKEAWTRWIGDISNSETSHAYDQARFALIFAQAVALIIASFMINLTWLKIWIAPKIWLIEYTATLVKG